MGEADSGIGYDGGCGGAKKRRRKAAAGEGKRVHVSAARSALIGVAVAAGELVYTRKGFKTRERRKAILREESICKVNLARI